MFALSENIIHKMVLQSEETRNASETCDVLIVGAGVSGINAAYQLQTKLPSVKLAIFEARDDIGGTWDLFRYPGVRPDSELYTYGFAWDPWPYPDPIGNGPLIKQYLKDCVRRHEINQHIRFHHKVLSADWSQDSQQWRVIVKHDEQVIEVSASFLILGTGYYDYNSPLQTVIPGLEDFKGKVIYPQFWPDDYEYQNKNMAIIGSGATCVSLFPKLAEAARQVTIVQRSPTYIISSKHMPPHLSKLLSFLPLPSYLLTRLDRAWNLFHAQMTAVFCEYFPARARQVLRILAIPQLPKGFDYDLHFQPRYNPWEQRLCLAPDGDFFQSLHQPNTDIVTGDIDKVTENSIRMQDGTVLDVDAIVAATGLLMRFGGDIAISVDGEEMKWEQKLIWNGAMLDGVPNMMFMLGYTNFSWTLGADNSAHILIRLLKLMKSKGFRSATPQRPEDNVETQKMWRLSSTYAARAHSQLPRYGMEGPWKPRIHALIDYFSSRWGDITSGLKFTS
ncbi:FAD/NAD(P)-binding domain-containing protein [Hypoxylon sp. FL0890]|nr:FAD/NAD(P)-binding domain-containing protein [Hypoxylon sp. FL0890]